ncbi:MAG: hypothetical protein JNM56_17265 [Planctomycetia bacterium]|nr:hypothetical protein [Planctomycetia bacterium]
MTPSEVLLRKLSDWQPGAGRHILTAADEQAGWSIGLTTERADTTGCQVWELTVRRAAPADLSAWAASLALRATGLLEPLGVHEVDAGRGEALLRSRQPTARGEQLHYYEVLLQSTGQTAIRRYQASHELGQHRKQVAFALTHEALAKLAEDLAG